MEHYLTIRAGDLKLSATLHYPQLTESERTQRCPMIIICHGFVGSKTGMNRLFVKAARAFSEAGYMVLRFDYGGCGESSGDYGEGGLHALIEQTRYVIDYALEIDYVDPNRLYLLGHSLGGTVALLTAARDKRVRDLILWAPSAHPFMDIVNITGRNVYNQCIEKGKADYLGYQFTPAFFQSLTEFQPLQEASRVVGDVLLIHGTSDDDIPVDYSFLLQKVFWMREEGQCEKEIIFQADHIFSSSEHSDVAIRKSIEWIETFQKRNADWYGWSI